MSATVMVVVMASTMKQQSMTKWMMIMRSRASHLDRHSFSMSSCSPAWRSTDGETRSE
jgi:predicted thioredoxin/glutaredoxin